MDFPLLPCANRFCGCFCLGSGPVFVLWCFSAFCFAFSAGETQVWLGDLRVVAFCVVVVSLFCFNRFADFKDFASLYRVFAAYSHVRTEPLARHRPHSRKKKRNYTRRCTKPSWEPAQDVFPLWAFFHFSDEAVGGGACEYMVLDRRASSRCTLGLDRCAPLFGTIVHWMMLL